MDKIITISVPCDSGGFLTLTCPSCKQSFKLSGTDFNDDSVVDIYCPLCGLNNKGGDFLTEEVREAAMREAQNIVADLLNASFKKIERKANGSKLLSVKTKKIPAVSSKALYEPDSMKILNFECCKKEAKIPDVVPATVFYCPFCGVNK